jgi:PEGA domain
VGMGVISATGLGISGVAPGKHEIVVSKPGYPEAKKTVTLASGDNRDVTIEMVPEPRSPKDEGATAAPDTATPEQAPVFEAPVTSSENRIGTKVAAWVTLAGGVASIFVGIRYSYLVSQANSNLDPYRRFECVPKSKDLGPLGDRCNNKNEPVNIVKNPNMDTGDPAVAAWIQKTRSSANRYQTHQWIGYGIGGALLVTSTVLFYRGYISPSSTSSSLADAHGSSLHLAPILAPNAVGAMAFTTF